MDFASLNLPQSVLRGIQAAGFTACTPIQEETLPIALRGRDVAGQAQTGTGKTAAFLIAIFTRLLREPDKRPANLAAPRALVVAPTRELAFQIHADACLLGRETGLNMQVVFGGVDYLKQREVLRAGVDVLIGTPGRLMDYLKQGVYVLSSVEVLVVDEADRMFDMGFIKDIRYLIRHLPPAERRQSSLFSATLSQQVLELAYESMNYPTMVAIAPEHVTVEGVEEVLYHVSKEEKFSLLLGLLEREKGKRIMMFANMKHEVERLARGLLRHGYHARAMTGDVDQKKRLSIMQAFKEGGLHILVATDVASRGLHIEGVTHVINYDLPQDPEDYVHRIGRTARAGATGKAISLVDEKYVMSLEAIEALIGHRIPVEWAEEALFLSERPRPMEAATPVPRPRKRRGGEPAWPKKPGPTPALARVPTRAPAPAPTAPAPAPSSAPAPPPVPAEGEPKKKRRRRRRRKKVDGAPPQSGADQVEADLTPLGI